MTSAESMLVALLAQVDAVFEPYRDARDKARWSSTWQLRQNYDKAGLPYRQEGSKEAERTLAELINAGYVVRRRGRSKTVGVILTLSGLRAAWPLAGFDPGNAYVVTEEVARLGPDGQWVRETAFNDGRGWGDGHSEELKEVSFFHRPALAARWIESNCDWHRRVGYRVTDAGRAALESDPKPAKDSPSPEAPEGAVDLYLRWYRDSIFWLDNLTPDAVGEANEIGELYLPQLVWATPDDLARADARAAAANAEAAKILGATVGHSAPRPARNSKR